jgi:hypothetical protein
MKNESIIPNAGRRGCGGCFSESHELMQFNGVLPGNCKPFIVFDEVPGARNDIQEVFSFIDLSLDKVASEKRQVEEIFS